MSLERVESKNSGRPAVTRRALLGASLACAACRPPAKSRDRKIHLRFSTYGVRAEIAAFQRIISRYEKKRPDVEIELEEIGYRTQASVDVELAAGVGPDLFRVQYLQVGRYSPSGSIIDLSRYLPANYGQLFTAPVWTAVQYKGRPHALPHQTDTSAILYNKSVFAKLGIKPPDSIENSWTWEEFLDVSRAVKRHACEYAFAVNWTFGGAFRWLNFLFQHGGSLLQEDFLSPAIPSPAAIETLRWTQSFFTQNLAPPSDSAKSTQQIENLFATGVVGMYFDIGPQSLLELKPPFDWSATFLPQDKYRAAELGGNAIAVSRDCKYPEVAVDFALFVTNETNMRDFVIAAEYLPVRKSLVQGDLLYPSKPDEMRVHLEQAKTVPLDLARTVTIPNFHELQTTLRDQLDLAFTGGQSAEVTLEQIARRIRRMSEPHRPPAATVRPKSDRVLAGNGTASPLCAFS